MPTDQIQNIITEVFAIEDSGVQIKLRDKNKRSLGSFFKVKKDGNPTMAFSQFQDMKIASGSVVEIGFKEVPYKDGLIKNIISFREAVGRPEAPVRPQNALQQPIMQDADFAPMPEEYPTKPTQDAFGRRLALHGFVNARLQNHTIQEVKLELDELLALEDFINQKL